MRKKQHKKYKDQRRSDERIKLIIRQEIKDPRIHMMTSVTSVEVAPDLKTCKAYISVMVPMKKRKIPLPVFAVRKVMYAASWQNV